MAMRLLPLNVAELCAHALELERACERRFDHYAERMAEIGERPLAMAFDRMARTLRREITVLAAASGERKPATLSPWEYAWRLTYMPEAVDDNAQLVPATAREVADVTGAGDTVIATLAVALASGATTTEAARVANEAAGIVVGKFGPATASTSELLAALITAGSSNRQ